MSQIGVMTTGAGVKTDIIIQWVPGYILIGAVNDDMPIQGLTLSVGGTTYQELSDVNVIQAISKYLMKGILGTDVKVGQIWKVSNGFIPDQTFKLTLENSGATTPAIYGFSDSKSEDGDMVNIGETSINARSKADFGNFTALFFEDTNFSKAEITFADGHTESELTLEELRSMFVMSNVADVDGTLGGVNVIDGRYGNIKNVRLFAGTGGALVVTSLTV